MPDVSGNSPPRVVVIGQGYVAAAGNAGSRDRSSSQGDTYVDDITDSDLELASIGCYLPTDYPAALAGFDIAVACMRLRCVTRRIAQIPVIGSRRCPWRHDNCYKRDMVGSVAWRRMEPDVPAWLAKDWGAGCWKDYG